MRLFRGHFCSKLLCCLVLALLLSSFVFLLAATSFRARIGSIGAVKAVNVGVYWDVDCSVVVTHLDWGVVEPGGSGNKVCFVRNEANVPIELSLFTENWSPLNASDYLSLTWNYDGAFLEVDEAVQVTFTLAVSSEVFGFTDFSFDIIVVGSG